MASSSSGIPESFDSPYPRDYESNEDSLSQSEVDDDLVFLYRRMTYGTFSNRIASFMFLVYRFFLCILQWLKSQAFTLSCIAFVLMDALITVMYKRLIDHTKNYVMVTMQIIIGTFASLIGIVYIFCSIFFKEYMSRPFSPRPLFVLGVLDMFSTGLTAIGSTHTSGFMLVLLSQIGVPLTMLTCYLILSKKYHRYQYISSVFILTFAVLKPLLSRDDSTNNRLFHNLIFMGSCIPDSIAAALRERQYTSRFFHVVKYQFYSLWLHFGFNLLFTTFTLPYTGGGILGYFENLAKLFFDGYKCLFFGINSIVDNCGYGKRVTCDDCGEAAKIFFIYLILSTILRISYVLIMMDGSVTFTFLLGTVKVPLTSIAFSLHFIAGDSVSTFGTLDLVCFFGIVGGLILYSVGSKCMQEARGEELSQPLMETSQA
ncbi:hypothetical protein BEWA_019320 [Theileria equi strain WA]|uniref:Uncharacterized protein n=1 Tax=Theileria equi strain WA TaxID=1537102 RepID=L0ATW4_THEEQ|nr:hypothetical protein BEWA_019320 [Theileria equi strain WA]AFZ79087.1 hypothetical protein BEWA_019320 [Theileria equi strain WA]|eukprot:XP_004828753.1 hypothetical protein BEWA_019320 [Theileria equi strain WA]